MLVKTILSVGFLAVLWQENRAGISMKTKNKYFIANLNLNIIIGPHLTFRTLRTFLTIRAIDPSASGTGSVSLIYLTLRRRSVPFILPEFSALNSFRLSVSPSFLRSPRRHRIISRSSPGIATENPVGAQKEALDRTMDFYRFDGILGTSGNMPARRGCHR